MNRLLLVGAAIVVVGTLSAFGQFDEKQLFATDNAVILTFVERPILSKLAKVPPGVYGKWSLVFSSPDEPVNCRLPFGKGQTIWQKLKSKSLARPTKKDGHQPPITLRHPFMN